MDPTTRLPVENIKAFCEDAAVYKYNEKYFIYINACDNEISKDHDVDTLGMVKTSAGAVVYSSTCIQCFNDNAASAWDIPTGEVFSADNILASVIAVSMDVDNDELLVAYIPQDSHETRWCTIDVTKGSVGKDEDTDGITLNAIESVGHDDTYMQFIQSGTQPSYIVDIDGNKLDWCQIVEDEDSTQFTYVDVKSLYHHTSSSTIWCLRADGRVSTLTKQVGLLKPTNSSNKAKDIIPSDHSTYIILQRQAMVANPTWKDDNTETSYTTTGTRNGTKITNANTYNLTDPTGPTDAHCYMEFTFYKFVNVPHYIEANVDPAFCMDKYGILSRLDSNRTLHCMHVTDMENRQRVILKHVSNEYEFGRDGAELRTLFDGKHYKYDIFSEGSDVKNVNVMNRIENMSSEMNRTFKSVSMEIQKVYDAVATNATGNTNGNADLANQLKELRTYVETSTTALRKEIQANDVLKAIGGVQDTVDEMNGFDDAVHGASITTGTVLTSIVLAMLVIVVIIWLVSKR